MSLFIIFILYNLLTLTLSNSNIEITEDDHSLILTDQNWDLAHSLHDYILVFYYKPDCESCQIYDDIFVYTAKHAKDMNHEVKFAFVDVAKETGVAAMEEIEQFPTIKLYHNKTGVEYFGVTGKDHLMDWLTERVNFQLKSIKTSSEALQVLKENSLTAFGCILNGNLSLVKNFEIVASLHNDIEFRLIQDPEICQSVGLDTTDNSLGIFQFEFNLVNRMIGQLERNSMNKFVLHHHVPIYAEFTNFIFTKSFAGHYHYFVPIIYKILPISVIQLKAEIRSIAKELDGKVVFIHFDLKNKAHRQFLEVTDIPHDEGFRVVESNIHMVNFKPPQSNNLNGSYMLQFIKDVMNNRVAPQLLSEEPPEDWQSHLIKPLVQKTFDELAHDHNRTVFVILYSPECKFSREVLDVMQQLAEYHSNQTDIEYAKFDITTNQHPRIKVRSTPTMFLFLKKSNEKIEFNGIRTFENMLKFVESEGKDGNERQLLEVDHLQDVKLTKNGLKHDDL